MRYSLLLLLAAAALLPSAAGAATSPGWHGVVVAKDVRRGTVAAAAADGSVRTFRGGRILAPGSRVVVSAARLADGSFRLARFSRIGAAHRVLVRGVVVRFDRARGRTLVAAGGSVLTLATAPGRRVQSVAATPRPGLRVLARATIGGDGTLVASSMQTLGAASTVQLAGIFTGSTATTVQLAVAGRGLVTVALPAGSQLPALSPGDEVQLVATVSPADGSLTLVSIAPDAAGGNAGVGVAPTGEVDVTGTIGALGATSITLQPGPGATPVVCALPQGASLAGFAVGDAVDAVCENQAGTLVLTDLSPFAAAGAQQQGGGHSDDDEEDDDDSGGPVGGFGAPLSGHGGSHGGGRDG